MAIVDGQLVPPFYAEDVDRVGFMLEPLTCHYCGSTEVVYNTLLHDGACQTCGRWQRNADRDEEDDVPGYVQVPLSIWRHVRHVLESVYEDCTMALDGRWDKGDGGFECTKESVETALFKMSLVKEKTE